MRERRKRRGEEKEGGEKRRTRETFGEAKREER